MAPTVKPLPQASPQEQSPRHEPAGDAFPDGPNSPGAYMNENGNRGGHGQLESDVGLPTPDSDLLSKHPQTASFEQTDEMQNAKNATSTMVSEPVAHSDPLAVLCAVSADDLTVTRPSPVSNATMTQNDKILVATLNAMIAVAEETLKECAKPECYVAATLSKDKDLADFFKDSTEAVRELLERSEEVLELHQKPCAEGDESHAVCLQFIARFCELAEFSKAKNGLLQNRWASLQVRREQILSSQAQIEDGSG